MRFSRSEVEVIASALFSAGVKHIEVGVDSARGSRLGIPCSDLIKAAALGAPKAEVGIFAEANSATIESIKDSVSAGARFVRVGVNATEVEKSLALVHQAKNLDITVTLNAMKTYAVPATDVLTIAEAARSAGADLFYVVDSAGCMLPDEVHRLVSILSDAQIPTGFHGHDNLSLAVANSLSAVRAGAVAVDGTLRGAGRSAGNAQIEVLVKVMQRAGYLKEVDGDRLAETAETLIAERRKRDRGVSHLDLVLGESRCHSANVNFIGEVAERWNLSLHALVRAVCRRDLIHASRAVAEAAAAELRTVNSKSRK
jgi:4-hydroxy-2-oxovalerate aldolase